jgi:hypothetical protein
MTDTSPCSFPPCDTGPGEPCDRHEREQSHTEGDHELCGDECPAVPAVQEPAVPAPADDDGRCARFVPDEPRAPGLCATCGDSEAWHRCPVGDAPSTACYWWGTRPHDAHDWLMAYGITARCPGWMPDDGTRPEPAPADDEQATLRRQLAAAQLRAEQVEELLSIARQCSNDAEAARQAAVQRAERAEAALEEIRADLQYLLDYRGLRHHHEQSGRWDHDGSPCDHCARLEQARQHLAALDTDRTQP